MNLHRVLHTHIGLMFVAASCSIAPLEARAAEDAAGIRIPITVKDEESGKAVPDAEVRFKTSVNESTLRTDGNGACTAELPTRKVMLFWVWASAPGYVPMRAAYPGRPSRQTRIELPEQVVFELERGRTIGGRVVNEQAQPVAGAAMKIDLYGSGDGPMPWIQNREIVTNDAGEWRIDDAPSTVGSITVNVDHPAAAPLREHLAGEPEREELAARYDEMLKGTCTYTLREGARVTGTVRDTQGNPVASAKVTCAKEHYLHGDEMATTDAQGTFAFHWEPQRSRVAVMADGFAPEMTELDIAPDQPPLEFALRPGKTLRGRVVNAQGQPIEGVSVGMENWRRVRYPVKWNTKTDTEGRFEWMSAPDEPFAIEVYGRNLMRVRDLPARTDGTEMVITVNEELMVKGTVKDSRTGEPVKAFTVVPGSIWGPNQPARWHRRDAAEYDNGEFEFALSSPQEGHALLIEADGYKPFQSPTYQSSDGRQTREVSLEPASALEGQVKTAAGEVAGKATVLVGTAGSPVFLESGKPMDHQDMVMVEADEQGRFSISAQSGPFTLIALHEAGVAVLDGTALAPGEAISLQPWCVVEGVLYENGLPAVDRDLSIDRYIDRLAAPTFLSAQTSVETDSEGRFRFDRVIPGLAVLAERQEMERNISQSVRFVPIDPKPGEVLRLTPGLNEGTVKGRLTIPEGTTRAVTFEKTSGRVSVSWKPPTPDNWESMSDDEKRDWSRNWQTSEDGRKWMEQRYRDEVGRGFQVNADGTFEVDGIRPGTYTMEIEVFEPAGSAIYQKGLIATVNKEVIVPGEPARAPVVDVGDIELQIEARVAAGDIAPVFEVKTVDGEPLRLEDYRGKHVFLDFWAVWCGPCKAELPNVRALYREFGSRSDFAVVSLSLDNDAVVPGEYAKSNDMPWVQGFLGKWSDDKVTKSYGVRGIPATFLIGPDGRVLARDLRGPEMVAEVRKILEKNTASN